MSWQAYVDSSLVGSNNVDKGAIFSAAGDSVWAATAGFNLSNPEMKAITSAIARGSDGSNPVYTDGFYINGERYVVTRVDDRSLYGRKGQEGVCCAKTTQAVVVGHHNKDQQVGNTANTVETLADYLVKSGY